MFKFITHKPLWANILAAILLSVILVFLFFSSLDWMTGYGQYEKVPDVTGQNLVAAQKILEDKGFEVEIQDSIYVDSIARSAVIKQSPDADATVKTGRTIYLTVNRAVPPLVDMPNLIGFSIRSAEMYMKSLGFKLGMVSYRPDIARNSVLEIIYNEQSIKPGTKIPAGSTISFVLGSGLGGDDMDVPDLIGLTLNEAKSYLGTIKLNIGSIIATGAIKDSAAAYIVKQSPAIFNEVQPGQKIPNKIREGQIVDVWINAVAPVRDTIRVDQNIFNQ